MTEPESKWAKSLSYALPIVIVAVSYIVCIIHSGMLYLSNDDTAIQNTLSGFLTGSPFPYHQFIHFLLSYPISLLYRIIPTVQWWYLYDHIILLFGGFLINIMIYQAGRRNKASLLLSTIYAFLLDTAFLVYSIANVSYTIAAGIIGSGGICLLLTVYENRRNQVSIEDREIIFNSHVGYWVSGVCIILSVLTRQESGAVLLCYTLLVFFYLYIKQKEVVNARNVFRFLSIVIILFVSYVVIGEINEWKQTQVNGTEWMEFNKARRDYTDYPHDSYKNNPELFDSVGISKETGTLMNNWCFMDKSITAENLRYIIANSKKEARTLDVGILSARWEKSQESRNLVACENVWIILTGLALIMVISGRKKEDIAICLLNITGTIILVFYQVVSGRIMYRSVIICLIPSATISVFLLLQSTAFRERKWILYVTTIIMTALCLRNIDTIKQITFNTDTITKQAEQRDREDMIYDYASKHPENFYIRENGLTYDRYPRKALKPECKNIIGWGGCDYNSRNYRNVLQNNGIKDVTGDVFKQSNVFLITVGQMDEDDVFFKWLKAKYGANGIVHIDNICNDIGVCRFTFDKDT